MTKVKICGVNSLEAFDAAVSADWIGFVFFPPSPRYITAPEAAALAARGAHGPRLVGLFVEPSDDEVAGTLATISLDVLQVYASPSRVAALASRFALPVWRAVPIERAADLPDQAGAAAALLIERKAPPDATRPGGNALTLDWSMMANWRPDFPWLLAGGLRPDNVATAIRESGAVAVDVSSGVETAPGRKSPALIREFIAAARSAGMPRPPR